MEWPEGMRSFIRIWRAKCAIKTYMKILTFTTLFPNKVRTHHGVFVKHRVTHLAKDCEVRVVAPVTWYGSKNIPQQEDIGGVRVYHPRYFITPKILRSLYGLFMFVSTLGYVRRLAEEFRFDVIDANFAYPDGLAAVMLGRALKKKVVITARGSDVNMYSKRPLMRSLVKLALSRASSMITVSQNLKNEMVRWGLSPEKINVVPNGVDREIFYPSNKKIARKILGLPQDKKIVLSIGNLIRSKGFHHLIQALDELQDRSIILYIIGSGRYKPSLKRSIAKRGLHENVRFVSNVPHNNLQGWYSAADVFCLISEKEGRPNVVLESLSCGTPVITMNKWGMDKIVKRESGILLERYNPDDVKDALGEILGRKWDRYGVRKAVAELTWKKTANRTKEILKKAAASRDILLFSSEDWDSGQQTSKHHLAANLSKDHTVVFIESIGLRAPKIGGARH